MTVAVQPQTHPEIQRAVAALVLEIGRASLDNPAHVPILEAQVAELERHAADLLRADAERQRQEAERAAREQRRQEAEAAERQRRKIVLLEVVEREATAAYLMATATVIDCERALAEAKRAQAVDVDVRADRRTTLRQAGVVVEMNLPEGCRDVALIRQEAQRQEARARYIRSGLSLTPAEQMAEAQAQADAAQADDAARRQRLAELERARVDLAHVEGDLAARLGALPERRIKGTELKSAQDAVARRRAIVAELEREVGL